MPSTWPGPCEGLAKCLRGNPGVGGFRFAPTSLQELELRVAEELETLAGGVGLLLPLVWRSCFQTSWCVR